MVVLTPALLGRRSTGATCGASPTPTLSWIRGGTTYVLAQPEDARAAPGRAVVRRASLPRSLADLPWPQRVLSVAPPHRLRRAARARPRSRLARTATTEKVCTVYLVDVSDSVPDEAIGTRASHQQGARAEKPKDGVVRVVTFARRPRVLDDRRRRREAAGARAARRRQRPAGAARRGDQPPGRAAARVRPLPAGYLQARGAPLRRRADRRRLLAEANRAQEFGVQALHGPVPPARPGRGRGPRAARARKVKVGETFELHADIYASRATKAQGASSTRARRSTASTALQELDLKAGRQRRRVQERRARRRRGDVRARARPRSPRTSSRRTTATRRRSTSPAARRCSTSRATPQHAQPPRRARSRRSSSTSTCARPRGFPGSLRELERYDFVILSDTPAEAVSLHAQDAHRAVRARSRRRLPLRRRRDGLRPRRLVPHDHRADPARAHGHRAQEGRCRAWRWRWSSTAPAR